MARRFQFTILDGMALVVIAAIVLAAVSFYSDYPSRPEAAEVTVWLVTLGVALVLGLVYRFGLSAESRLLVLGLTVTMAGVTDGVYLAQFFDSVPLGIAVVVGLSVVGGILVTGSVIAGGRGRAGRDVAEPVESERIQE